jgi:hypothetical protein
MFRRKIVRVFKDVKVELTRHLIEKELSGDDVEKAIKIVSSWVDEIVFDLEKKIKEWEKFEMEEGGLYTLGLRRAVDKIIGEVAMDKLPILETNETQVPDEEEREDG